MWSFFMNRFSGDRSIGPFGKLLEVAEQVGWCIEIPGFYNHDGCWISLLDATEGILRGVAEKAWGQYVAKEISKRKDFEDLQGIDLAVFKQAQRRLDRKTRSFLQPSHSGWIIPGCKGTEQVRHGKGAQMQQMRSGRHSRAQVLSLREVCLRACKGSRTFDTTLRMQSSLHAHLLPSRNAEWKCFKHFLNTPEIVERRALRSEWPRIDLFTDGSCWNPDLIADALGAWAVVCPQADRWVIRGTLSALRQHNDKTEVQAIKNALDISFDYPGEVVIWSDSSCATSGLFRLLQDGEDIQMIQVRVFGQKSKDLSRIERVRCGFNTLQLIEMVGKKTTL
jgi:ribonuclease HI